MSAMPSLHLPARNALHRGMAACALVAAAACSDNNVSGLPTIDLNLSRIAGFEPLKAALLAARREANGGVNLDMWAAVVERYGRVDAGAVTGASGPHPRPGGRGLAA